MNLFEALSDVGKQVVNAALGIKNSQPVRQVQQEISSRFNQFSQTAQPLQKQLQLSQALRNLTPKLELPTFRAPQAPDFSAITQRFNEAQSYAGKGIDSLKPNFDAFYRDLGTRVNRVERYIQPVINYGQDLAEFAQGKGPRAENFRNSAIAKITPEDMAMNFTPMGYTNAAKPLLKGLAEEGKAILKTLPKNDRLQHIIGYGNELLRAGFSKPQIDKIGAQEAASILKQGLRPSDIFGSGNESMKFLKDVADEVRKIKDPLQTSKTIDDAIQTVNVKNKVNILDYLKTPEKVLNKIGLGKHAQELRGAYDRYLDELPVEIDKVTQWSKRAPGAQQRIFQWLDGKKIELADNELQVATEIKSYLKNWATKLGLPEDKQISNYITHIFEPDFIKKEFDPDIAALIRDKVAGSVYDPFLQKRVNQGGYIEDAWRALDAYVKRATRKVNLDPTLQKISAASENLEDSQFKYVKSYIDRINMRPTDIDNLVDNFIKSSPFGYRAGQRPLTVVTQKARQMVYRGLLGLNPKTALLNLTQGANTYAALGEKYTLIGYSKVIQNMPKFLAGKGTELHEVGILRNNFIEDRTLNATKQTMQKLDEGLFYLFNLAEKINRGAAYWGAKSKALNQGMSEAEAIKYAKELVRKTQFTFGSVDTPLALSSDLMKTAFQFQSYTLKQGEFLGSMAKNKDYAGLVRWTGASLFMVATLGRLWGMKVEDLIPSVRLGVPPTLQAGQGVWEVASGQKDQFGNEPDPNIVARALKNKNLQKGVTNYVPAGAQIRKSLEGLNAVNQLGVYSNSGRLRYPTDDGARSVIFGPNTSQYAKDYYSKNLDPLSETETRQYKMLIDSGMSPEEAYNKIRTQETADKQFKQSLNPGQGNGFDWFGLSKPQATPQPVTTPTGDPLLDAVSKQKAGSDQDKKIKEIFTSGLNKQQIETLLKQNNLGSYEDASILMVKSLGIENGQRGEYLKSLLTGLGDQDYKYQIVDLASKELLTTGVTAQWAQNGDISDGQKKAIDELIKLSKSLTNTGGVYTGKIKAKVKKGLPVKRIAVSLPKNPKLKKIQPPKLTAKTLKPIKLSKIREISKRGVKY